MSHLKERKDKNCLNCNAQVYGKYCHICGQENIEPAESVWHLITHFFNDITHFDGKFFSSLKLLVTKPGFLSAEYKRGRRASYLNPVRMYIFTSFVFFIIFFTVVNIEESIKSDGKQYTKEQIYKMDSVKLAELSKDITDGKVISRDELIKYIDSTESDMRITFNGKTYKNKAQYDSLLKAGTIKPGWLEKKIAYKQFEVAEKYKDDSKSFMTNIINVFLHLFPQILFVSLPAFAFILWLLYFRRKEYYFVSHGIYTVHLYIFYFISLLFLIAVNKIASALNWDSLFGWVSFLLSIGILIYEYKAMRHFYQQRRAKTMIKFFLAVICRFILFILLAIGFLVFSIFKI